MPVPDDRVRAQYETYPYPPRDPADEARRLITGSPSHIDELNHYVFGGRRDFAAPFRVLIAGGGTGDGAIMLAQQLADVGAPADLLYIDVSDASRAIAEARAKARGLANNRFERLSLLEVPGSGLGPFNYIDCCGVLHHLEDPDAGLAALASVLADDGGIGLMVYGALGRTGVYPVQEMLRMLAAGDPAAARIEAARRLLAQLPPTNWLRRNPLVADHLEQGDAGLFDLLLHARDRAYRVAEIARMVEGAGLRLVSFIEPAFYDPASYLTDPALLSKLAERPWIERAAFAELLAGTMKKHTFYVVRADNPIAPPDPGDGDVVPVLRDLDPAAFPHQLKPGAAMTAMVDGITFRRPLPPLAGVLLRNIDGRRTLTEIYAELANSDPNLSWDQFREEFAALFAALNGLGKIYLRAITR